MDRVRGLILIIVSLFSIQLCCLVSSSNANMVFPVQRKFKGPHESLDAIKAHDARRHGRFLSAVDVPLGGNGLPSSTGFAFFSFPFSLSFVFHILSLLEVILFEPCWKLNAATFQLNATTYFGRYSNLGSLV